GAGVIIRGLRAVADFEYEFQMTMMNRHLRPQVETIFMMTGETHFYTSSRLVKEVVSLGGSVDGLIPDAVLPLLVARAARYRARRSASRRARARSSRRRRSRPPPKRPRCAPPARTSSTCPRA